MKESHVISLCESSEEPDEESNDDNRSDSSGEDNIQMSQIVELRSRFGAIVMFVIELSPNEPQQSQMEQSIYQIEHVEEESQSIIFVSGNKSNQQQSGPDQQSIEQKVIEQLETDSTAKFVIILDDPGSDKEGTSEENVGTVSWGKLSS